MTLFVHRAERADRLALGLAELLSNPLPDPFATEVVAVPARGVERWLAQRLSHGLGGSKGGADGICANVRFPSPGALFQEIAGVPEEDPWRPENLIWPVLATIDAGLGQEWARMLTTHLGQEADDDRRGRRLAVARRLAGLFSSYAEYRPELLRAWAAGMDTDGCEGRALPTDLRWQAELWRHVGAVIPGPDPAARLSAAAERARTEPGSLALPERISIFGSTRLPAGWRQVLAALAVHRDVHLWVPHPSPRLWQRLAEVRPTLPLRRSADPTVLTAVNPLLSSLGRDSRELQLVLADTGLVDHHDEHLGAGPSEGSSADITLLGALQRGIAADLAAPSARMPVPAQDRSVQIHTCHGRNRQVEVLRDVITGLLAADRSLQPRDILVMCPDIETFAPLLTAAFGGEVVGAAHPAQALPVRLADRALRRSTPLLATVARLLDLVGERTTRTDLLDLAAMGPIRRRFGFDDADLELLGRWTADAGVRWGLDAEHRAPFGLQRHPQGTWRSGLDRVLLGVAMSGGDRGWVGTALPLDDVGSGDVEVAGRVAEFVERLGSTLDELTGPHTLDRWAQILRAATQRLTRPAEDDGWQSAAWYRQLAEIVDGAGERAASTVLALSDVRALLASRLAGRPTRANFRTGGLTVCTMVPMRSVPHRVVCLLGMDDGVFPRSASRDGDDVLARDPLVGERDHRGEDRQLLLDALLAATDTVVVLYTGADERTGAHRPPAAPIGELIDALDGIATAVDGGPARNQVVVHHPLQPFDSRSFAGGSGDGNGPLGAAGPFSFDPGMLAAAVSASEPRVTGATPAERAGALPAGPQIGVIELGDLTSLLEHPAREFLRHRMQIDLPRERAATRDALPVELTEWDRWAAGERILADLLAGVDPDTCTQLEWRRGLLPPGPLGRQVLTHLLAEAQPLASASAALRAAAADTVHSRAIDLTLDNGRRLRGTVGGLYGNLMISAAYRHLAAGPVLRAWIAVVALTAAHPDIPWTAHVLGRRVRQVRRRPGEQEEWATGTPWQTVLGPITHDQAWETLARQVDLFERGLRAPLPMAARSSAAYATARRDHVDTAEALAAAGLIWAGDRDQGPGERNLPAHRLLWGHEAPFARLADSPPPAEERWAGESTRFGELARRLWTPLFAAERSEPLS
ncbi:exodeoxyribonuclease V subunit gamma [Nakamurella silvestris]|nr:exodeoxyribonuclease V subunit gamma [Nakamurella silvestris]